MSRDLQAILRDLADTDAQVEHVALGTPPDSDVNTLAQAIREVVDIVRELAERTR